MMAALTDRQDLGGYIREQPSRVEEKELLEIGTVMAEEMARKRKRRGSKR